MSITPEDLNRIQEWLADLYGTTPDNCPVSRETIRKVCRGPMKDVFLGFLISRFRTDEQIKTIRSNLFIYDAVNQKSQENERDDDEDSIHRKQVKELKQGILSVHAEKQDLTKRVVKHCERISESSASLNRNALQVLSKYEKTESKLLQTQERVYSSNELIKDVQNVVPSITPASTQFMSYECEDALINESGLRSLYQNALELFDVHCSTKASDSTSLQLATLNEKVHSQMGEIAHSGLSPTLIEGWVESEQDQAFSQLYSLEGEFTNVMNPVEEFSAEAEALYQKLLQVHIILRKDNTELKQELHKLRKKLRKHLLQSVHYGGIDFKKLGELLEIDGKTSRTQQFHKIANTIAQWEMALEKDEDVIHFFTNDSKGKATRGKAGGGESDPQERLSPFSGGSGRLSFASSPCSPEVLEDLTCALLKSFPVSKHQLETTLKNSKLLILEMFPELCEKLKGYHDGNSEFLSAQKESTTEEQTVTYTDIPESILLQGGPCQEAFAIKKRLDMVSEDYLTEIFRLDGENEKKAKEYEMLLKERESLN